MKKIIALLALAGVASLGFAQDAPTLKFNGYLNSGLAVHTDLTHAAPFYLYGNDAGKAGGRFNLDGVYANGDSGLKFEFRSEGTLGTAPVLKYGYVYANVFDKLVTVNAGIVKDSTFNTAGDAAYKPVDSEAGLQVIGKPMAGLAFGLFLNVPNNWASTGAPVVAGATTTANVATSNSFDDVGLDFNGLYTLDKAVSVVLGAKSYPTASAKYTSGEAYSGLLEYYAGVNLLAVDNLTAVLEVKGSAVNDYAATGNTTVTETVKYNLKDVASVPVTIGVAAYQFLYGDKQLDTDLSALGVSMKLNPFVAYQLDPVTGLKLGATYISGKETYNANWDKAKLNVAGETTVGKDATAKYSELAALQIKPEVSFALSPSLTVTAFYAMTTSMGAKDVYYLNVADKNKILHTFDVDFLYKF